MAIQNNYSFKGKYKLSNNPGGDLTPVLGEGYNEIIRDITIEKAYIRIDQVSGTKECLNIMVGVYDSRKLVLVELREYSFVANLDSNSDNFIKQGYEYLKGLHEYADAVDVLEEGQLL